MYGGLCVRRDGTEANGLIDVLCPVEWHGCSIHGVVFHWVCVCAFLPHGLLIVHPPFLQTLSCGHLHHS